MQRSSWFRRLRCTTFSTIGPTIPAADPWRIAKLQAPQDYRARDPTASPRRLLPRGHRGWVYARCAGLSLSDQPTRSAPTGRQARDRARQEAIRSAGARSRRAHRGGTSLVRVHQAILRRLTLARARNRRGDLRRFAAYRRCGPRNPLPDAALAAATAPDATRYRG